MPMTQFEKALIKELQGIRKELHELNKKEPVQGQVDGVPLNVAIDIDELGNNLTQVVDRQLGGRLR